MENRKQPPSLQEIALRAVVRRHMTVTRVLELMRYFKKIDWMIEQGPLLKGKCTNFLRQTYWSIERKHSHQELVDTLGKELLSRLEKESSDLRTGIQRMKTVGRVLERPRYEPIRSLSTPPMGRSVSGKQVYSYGRLRTGLEWPKDVDASSREEHLDDNEFQHIFSVPYDVYQQYPKWKQIRLKKRHGLF